MPLVTGSWNANINGVTGQLIINGVAADSSFSGTILGIPIWGFWNELAQSIYFEMMNPIIAGAGGQNRAQFIGYLFSTPPVVPVGTDVNWTICGHVTVSPTNSPSYATPNARRFTFGWMAQITQVV